MDLEQLQEIITYLTRLATPIAQAGFELALRQVYVKLAQNIVIGLAALVLTYKGIRIYHDGKQRIKALEAEGRRLSYSEKEGHEITQIFLIVGLFVTTGTMIVTLLNAVSYMINPNWYAIQLILRTVK